MRTFTDSRGHQWAVIIDTNAVRRAKEASGLYLVDVITGDDAEVLFRRLARDPCLVVDVAWGVCSPEAEATKFSREDFAAVLVGDAIDEARTAILEGLVDFFPRRVREALEGKPGDPSTPGDSSGESPESSESTPAP